MTAATERGPPVAPPQCRIYAEHAVAFDEVFEKVQFGCM